MEKLEIANDAIGEKRIWYDAMIASQVGLYKGAYTCIHDICHTAQTRLRCKADNRQPYLKVVPTLVGLKT